MSDALAPGQVSEPIRLPRAVQEMVTREGLAYVATVNRDGTPNLSPKGTLAVWSETSLAFADLRSPQTVANLAANAAVEINVVDPIIRKGYRFHGVGDLLTSEAAQDRLSILLRRQRGIELRPARCVVVVTVTACRPLVSPAYDGGASEEEVAARFRRKYLHERAG